MMESGDLAVAFVRKLQATFGERARQVAESERDAAPDGPARAAWTNIVDLLKGGAENG